MLKGLVEVYTGTGKGKTTASLGLSLRAVGHNLRIYMVQFMKSGDTGELFSIQRYIPNMTVAQFGVEAIKEKQMKIFELSSDKKAKNTLKEDEVYRFPPDEEEREAVRQGFEHAKKIVSSGRYDIVVLDEVNCVLSKGLLDISEFIDFVKNKPEHVELILTGRDAPKEVMDVADLVSEIRRVKHPYDKGILARKGIEY